MKKVLVTLAVLTVSASVAFAADLGCGRDTDMNGSVDSACPGADKDFDGYTSAQGDCNDLDWDIWPGATWMGNKVGCATGYYRTCKADGSGWGTCTQDTTGSRWCPNSANTTTIAGGVAINCYYFDAVNGDDANDGSYASPFKSLDKIAYGNAGAHTPVPGDAFILLPGGSYTSSYSTWGLRLSDGTSANPIFIVGYPHTGYSDYPVVAHSVRYTGIDYLKIQNFAISHTTNASGTSGIQGGTDASLRTSIRGLYIHDIVAHSTSGCDNTAGISIDVGSQYSDISRNTVRDAYCDYEGPSYHGYGILLYRTDGVFVGYNNLVNTASRMMASGIIIKHQNYDTSGMLIGNYIKKSTDGFQGGWSNHDIIHNLVSTVTNSAISMRDVGGVTHLGGATIEYNTWYGDLHDVEIIPLRAYHMDNTPASDDCSSDEPPWAVSTYRYNIGYSPSATNYRPQDHGYYSADDLRTKWLVESKWVSNYNAYFSAQSATMNFDLFTSNNSCNTACCARGVYGSQISGLVAIQAAGFEANSIQQDPVFDSRLIPTATAMTSWGYMGGEQTSSEVTIPTRISGGVIPRDPNKATNLSFSAQLASLTVSISSVSFSCTMCPFSDEEAISTCSSISGTPTASSTVPGLFSVPLSASEMSSPYIYLTCNPSVGEVYPIEFFIDTRPVAGSGLKRK